MGATDDSGLRHHVSSGVPAPLARLINVVPEGLLWLELEKIAETTSKDAAFTSLANKNNAALRMDFATGERSNGSLRLRKFYISAQVTEHRKFHARTFVFDRKSKQGAWLDFPDDPALPGAVNMETSQVLRYIPLRRLTLVAQNARGENVVWKFKRAERFFEAVTLLKRMGAVILGGEHGFSVPRPLETCEKHAAFSQTMALGTHLTPNDIGSAEVLKLARVLTAMQQIQLDGVTSLPNSEVARNIINLLAWISALVPSQMAALSEISRHILASVPEKDPPCFCHGDFNIEQVLVDPAAGWTLLDFDRVCYASTCHDVANLIVTWEHRMGVPFPVDALLAAIAIESSKPLEESALSWHLCCAKIHRLAQSIKKGRLDAAGVRELIAVIGHQACEIAR